MTETKKPNTKSSDRSGRAADDLFRIFEDMINAGAMPEGSPLPPEREIVQTYGVSRTVVREAILALANKGLVDARPRYRPVVRRSGYDAALETVENVIRHLLILPDGVKNLFETRILIEAALARQAAVEAGKDDIAAMKSALEANEAAIDDNELFYKTDMAFHQVLYDIPKNPVLPVFHKGYTAWLAPHWSKMRRDEDRNQDNHQSHKAVFDAILMRDPDAAEAALRAHLADAWEQVRLTFGDI